MAPHHDYSMYADASIEHSQRACQTCGTTVTSQWRYGHSGKVLLCNACGIRWKRKNKATGDKKRLKPGPKRTRQHMSHPPPIPQPCALEPSLSAMFYGSASPHMSSKNFSSSSSSTDPRLDSYRQREHNSSHHHRRADSRQKSKMDLDTLMSPSDAYPPSHSSRRSHHKPSKRPYSSSSPIAINNLLNFSDDDYAHTAYSKSRHY